jgi:uncharacterized membrane protein YgdD (TMEM256/DUF423 family)
VGVAWLQLSHAGPTISGYSAPMNSLARLGIVLLAFAGIVFLIPLVDDSPDAATAPIGAVLAIAGLALLAIGSARRPT